MTQNQLNDSQCRAVETIDGKVLILAGAGSGKTRVLTMRMAYLIQQHRVSPRSLLGLTFTNKAAAEMRHRVAALVGASVAKQLTLSTFHSFCMQILRKEIHHLGYTADFTLYNEYDVQRLVRFIVRDFLGREGELPSIAPTLEIITAARNQGLKPEELVLTDLWHDQFTCKVYRRFQEDMRAYNAVDFDNLLGLTIELFEKFPAILDAYQELYRYIMIDEYQDTNPVQDRLAHLLASKYGNLCVVGDDDQSIYGWRGAVVDNILHFPCDIKIRLEQNYRSTNTILKAANAVIANNKNRHDKVLWSECGEGEKIEVFYAPDEKKEAAAVVARIAKLRERENFRWRDIAILYRSNALSLKFETALLEHYWKEDSYWKKGIPYRVFGGTEFYEKREIKDLFAYLRVIVNPLDQEALLRIINVPRRGIGDASLAIMTNYNRSHALSLWSVLKGLASKESSLLELQRALSVKNLSAIATFVKLIETAQEYFVSASLAKSTQWLISAINYDTAIKEEVKSDQMREFRSENINNFVAFLAEHDRQGEKDQKKSLQEFVAHFPLNEHRPHTLEHQEEDKVTLMTFHSAKGLEFKACFLVGIEDHIIPHEKSCQGEKEEAREEERRLMYVALTRAMHRIVISMACERNRMGKTLPSQPSRFLYEIPKELLHATHWAL